MERIRECVSGWLRQWSPTQFAALAASAIVIAVVPGALTAWLAWRLLRARGAS